LSHGASSAKGRVAVDLDGRRRFTNRRPDRPDSKLPFGARG
jgi:hypothetical protein